MRLIITGVPGTGKTVLAQRLAKRMRLRLVKINDVVERRRLWKGKDRFGAKIVRMGPLQAELKRLMEKGEKLLVEGHLACEFPLPADLVVVCRTSPKLLEKRLSKRKYPRKKADENLMAEMLDYCTICSLANYPKRKVFEIDTGKELIGNVREVEQIAKGRGKKFSAGWVDWSRELEKQLG